MADLGMALHRSPLLIGERASLEQDLVGDRDLADVVERAGFTQQSTPVLVETEAARDLLAHARHSLGVMAQSVSSIRNSATSAAGGSFPPELAAARAPSGSGGRRVEKLLLRSAPLGELGLHAVVEESIVENDPAILRTDRAALPHRPRSSTGRLASPRSHPDCFPYPERCSGSRDGGGLRRVIPGVRLPAIACASPLEATRPTNGSPVRMRRPTGRRRRRHPPPETTLLDPAQRDRGNRCRPRRAQPPGAESGGGAVESRGARQQERQSRRSAPSSAT